MSSIFSSIIATFVTMPFLGYVVVFIISKQLTGNHRRSVLLAIDVSTFLLIISVHYLTVAIWKKSFLGIIFITILITAIIFVFFSLENERGYHFSASFQRGLED